MTCFGLGKLKSEKHVENISEITSIKHSSLSFSMKIESSPATNVSRTLGL